MVNKPDRIVIDTNLWISFLLSNTYSKLEKLIEEDKLVFIFSLKLIDEFLEVASRPKFKRYFTQEEIISLMNVIQLHAEFIKVKTKVKRCRDTKDDFLLALCEDGKADFLLTGDEDLLVLKKHKKTRIIKISEYLKK